jgi:hypothetical protein
VAAWAVAAVAAVAAWAVAAWVAAVGAAVAWVAAADMADEIPGRGKLKLSQNLGLNPGLNGRLLQLGQGLKQFLTKEEKYEKENGLLPDMVRAPFGGRAPGAQPGAGAGETRGQLL